jgi:hypothetical protein
MSLREIGLPTPVPTGRRGRYLQLTFCFPWAELADFPAGTQYRTSRIMFSMH